MCLYIFSGKACKKMTQTELRCVRMMAKSGEARPISLDSRVMRRNQREDLQKDSMYNYFNCASKDDKEMASPNMEGQLTVPNQEKYQVNNDQPAEPSRRSNTRRSSTTQQQRERRRENDRKFRQRKKEREHKMKENLHLLNEENVNLKRENQVLITERNSMTQNLQSADMEILQLQSEILTLNSDIATGQQLVDLYSNMLVASNGSNQVFELKQLEIENYILRQIDRQNWDSEKELLLQHMAGLEVEYKKLKIMHQALSELVNANENGQQ